MTSTAPARARTYRTPLRRGRVAGVLAVVAAIAVALANHLPASSSTTAPPSDVLVSERPPSEPVRNEPSGPGDLPGAADLDPQLAEAVRAAAADAAAEGVRIVITSGRRTPEHQQRLLDEAVSKYGSLEEASRWVAAPNVSAHVSGEAVDVGPDAARAWLSEHGARYGLCQIYANEPWHFELRAQADTLGCPATYPDPTHDPELQP